MSEEKRFYTVRIPITGWMEVQVQAERPQAAIDYARKHASDLEWPEFCTPWEDVKSFQDAYKGHEAKAIEVTVGEDGRRKDYVGDWVKDRTKYRDWF